MQYLVARSQMQSPEHGHLRSRGPGKLSKAFDHQFRTTCRFRTPRTPNTSPAAQKPTATYRNTPERRNLLGEMAIAGPTCSGRNTAANNNNNVRDDTPMMCAPCGEQRTTLPPMSVTP
jgi:hypothetical protein